MKTNKIHLYKRDRSHDRAQTACGATHKKSKGNIAAFKEFETDTPKELLCKTCLNTVFYDEKKAEFERKRKLEKGEFEEPKKLKILSTLKALVVSNLNSEQFNKLYDFIESKKLDKYSNKNKGLIEVYQTKEDYNCVLDFINNGFEEPTKDLTTTINNITCAEVDHYKQKLKDCGIAATIGVISEVDSIMIYTFKNLYEKGIFDDIMRLYKEEPKTQLDKDAEKFNLNKEQKEYLSGFDYEVVEFEYCSCNACLFNRTSIQCPRDEKGACSCQQNNKEYKFKQIHKTQSSLNKSIEKEGLKDIEKPFESVADVVDEVIKNEEKTTVKINTSNLQKAAEKASDRMDSIMQKAMKDFGDNLQGKRKERSNEQQADHYKKETNEGLETHEKLQLLSDKIIELGLNYTPIQIFDMFNGYKYFDRLGKKDNTDKEVYKILDYDNKRLKNKWIHEK